MGDDKTGFISFKNKRHQKLAYNNTLPIGPPFANECSLRSTFTSDEVNGWPILFVELVQCAARVSIDSLPIFSRRTAREPWPWRRGPTCRPPVMYKAWLPQYYTNMHSAVSAYITCTPFMQWPWPGRRLSASISARFRCRRYFWVSYTDGVCVAFWQVRYIT